MEVIRFSLYDFGHIICIDYLIFTISKSSDDREVPFKERETKVLNGPEVRSVLMNQDKARPPRIENFCAIMQVQAVSESHDVPVLSSPARLP